MTISEEILTIANKLANNGTQPTVALIKAKLSVKVALPLIISHLKSWEHDPTYTLVKEKKVMEDEIIKNKATFVSVEELIKEALKPIKQELADIKVQLAELIKSQPIK